MEDVPTVQLYTWGLAPKAQNLQEQDESSDIEQQPPFSNIKTQTPHAGIITTTIYTNTNFNTKPEFHITQII